MAFDDEKVWAGMNPWSAIPPDYNFGSVLTRGQVLRGHRDKPALLWEKRPRAKSNDVFSIEYCTTNLKDR